GRIRYAAKRRGARGGQLWVFQDHGAGRDTRPKNALNEGLAAGQLRLMSIEPAGDLRVHHGRVLLEHERVPIVPRADQRFVRGSCEPEHLVRPLSAGEERVLVTQYDENRDLDGREQEAAELWSHGKDLARRR